MPRYLKPTSPLRSASGSGSHTIGRASSALPATKRGFGLAVRKVEADDVALASGLLGVHHRQDAYFFRTVAAIRNPPRATALSTVTQTIAHVRYQGTPAPRSVATGSGRIRFCPRMIAATARPNVTSAATTSAARFMKRIRSGGR